MGKSQLPRVLCPNCGKRVAANYSPKTVDGCNVLTFRHKNLDGQPCPQVEVSRI